MCVLDIVLQVTKIRFVVRGSWFVVRGSWRIRDIVLRSAVSEMVDGGLWTVDRTSLIILSALGGTNHAMSGIRRPASDFRLSFAENTPKSDGRQWTVDCGQNQPERAIRRRRN